MTQRCTESVSVHLNHTGATVWNALGMRGGDLSLAARAVSQRYGMPFHQVLIDIRLLGGKLTDARLLNRRARRGATVREVTDLLDAIDQASRWLPTRIACLERSLAVLL